MVEMTRSGLSYRWSSMAPGERRVFAQAMAAFGVAGFIIGFLAGLDQKAEAWPVELRAALALLPMIPFALAVWRLRVFGRFLDELHWKIDHKATHLGVRLFALVATPLALLDGLADLTLLPAWGYVALMYCALVVGCVMATRQLMAPGED